MEFSFPPGIPLFYFDNSSNISFSRRKISGKTILIPLVSAYNPPPKRAAPPFQTGLQNFRARHLLDASGKRA
ncbi:MAG: hypothetical protein Q4C91_16400, partial [Eubacteriales bacterium]|nr:hypothetical protein [Eubacteriales bacterium]